jgi:hypothetical protein
MEFDGLSVQQPNQVVDISSWATNDDFGIFPIGSKPKRLVVCPDSATQSFLIPGHTYLFKNAEDWRSLQLWSEVLAYRLSMLCGINVPPCFVATVGPAREPGVLMEWFYNYPGDRETRRMVHGVDLMQQAFGSDYDAKAGRPHSLQRNIAVSRLRRAPNALEWWGRTVGFDALIGNTDRHAENWGLLRTTSGAWEMAPAFDNGTSLGYMIRDAALPMNEADLERHVARGRHHFTWEHTAKGPGDGFVALCQQLCTAIPKMREVIGRLLPTPDAPIAEIIHPLTRFDVSVRFSSERAIFVERLIRARRNAIAAGIGV